MSDSGVLSSEDWKTRNQERRILLTFVDLVFVRAEDIKTERMLNCMISKACR